MTASQPMLGVLIAQGLLRPDEEPFARAMIATHGMDTFAAFIAHRQLQQGHASTTVQAEINRLLGVSPEIFAKYNR